VSKEMLISHPAALSAAVLARPDAKSGDVLAAYTGTNEDVQGAAEGIAACRRTRPARHAVPGTATALIQKFVLRHPAKSSSAIE